MRNLLLVYGRMLRGTLFWAGDGKAVCGDRQVYNGCCFFLAVFRNNLVGQDTEKRTSESNS